MKTGGLVSSDDTKAMIADTLRMFVGAGRQMSWQDLAAATQDKECTLRSHVRREPEAMPLDRFLRVFAVLPPGAFARVARAIGFSATPAEFDDMATVRRALAQSAHLVARGTAALEDGELDHQERAAMASDAAELLPTLQALASGERLQ